MGTIGTLLTPEAIGTSLAGFFIFGLIVRSFFKGWLEARTATTGSTTTAMVSAVSIQWDRDQRELLLQTLTRIADAHELQAKFQQDVAEAASALADKHRQNTEDKLGQILERLDQAEQDQRRSPPRR